MNRRLSLAVFALLLFASPGCMTGPQPDNTLSLGEKFGGWQLLFDGRTFNGWRGYVHPGEPIRDWEIKDGLLKTIPQSKGYKGMQLITEKTFTDFELSWEWRIAPAGNNGIKYFVSESRPNAPGSEYQMIDDERNSDAKRGVLYQTAAFYDVFPAAADKPSKPAGEWNASRIIVRGVQVEHWLNGKNVLSYTAGSAAMKAGIARSKFSKEAGFGEKITSPIMLTYHEDECWYRNIKIRELR